MSVLPVDRALWSRACTQLGWQADQADQLWAALGGADSLQLSWEQLYRSTLSIGWTAEHAEVLWKTVALLQAPVPPAPAAPGVPPVAVAHPGLPPQGASLAQVAQASLPQAPWERTAADPVPPTPAKRTKRTKTEKPAGARRSLPLPALGSGDSALAVRRLGAILVDGALVLALGLGVGAALQLGPMAMLGHAATVNRQNLLVAGLAWSLLAGLYFLLTMRRDSFPGQSLGKQLLGLRVVRTGGEPLDPRTILVRQAAGVVLLPWLSCWLANQVAFPAGLVICAVWLLVSLRGRGIPDLLAATAVEEA